MLKKVLVMVVCICLLATIVTACGQSQTKTESTPTVTSTAAATTEAPATEAKKPKTIGVVLIAGNNPLCQELDKGVRSIAEPRGDKVVTLDANGDQNASIKCVEDLIAQGVDAIVLENFDFKAPTSVIQQAKEKGILVAITDNLFEVDDLVVSQSATDNVAAGRMCGEDLVKKVKEPTEIVILDYPGIKACDDRVAGFKEAIAANTNIKVVDQKMATDTAVAASTLENMLQAHKNIKGGFGIADIIAMGMAATMESAGKLEGSFLYAVDGSPAGIKAVKEGKITGTAKQNHFQLGVLPMQDIYTVMDGGKVTERLHMVPTILITSDNVDEYLK